MRAYPHFARNVDDYRRFMGVRDECVRRAHHRIVRGCASIEWREGVDFREDGRWTRETLDRQVTPKPQPSTPRFGLLTSRVRAPASSAPLWPSCPKAYSPYFIVLYLCVCAVSMGFYNRFARNITITKVIIVNA